MTTSFNELSETQQGDFISQGGDPKTIICIVEEANNRHYLIDFWHCFKTRRTDGTIANHKFAKRIKVPVTI